MVIDIRSPIIIIMYGVCPLRYTLANSRPNPAACRITLICSVLKILLDYGRLNDSNTASGDLL